MPARLIKNISKISAREIIHSPLKIIYPLLKAGVSELINFFYRIWERAMIISIKFLTNFLYL